MTKSKIISPFPGSEGESDAEKEDPEEEQKEKKSLKKKEKRKRKLSEDDEASQKKKSKKKKVNFVKKTLSRGGEPKVTLEYQIMWLAWHTAIL